MSRSRAVLTSDDALMVIRMVHGTCFYVPGVGFEVWPGDIPKFDRPVYAPTLVAAARQVAAKIR